MRPNQSFESLHEAPEVPLETHVGAWTWFFRTVNGSTPPSINPCELASLQDAVSSSIGMSVTVEQIADAVRKTTSSTLDT